MKLTLANIKELKRKSDSPLTKRVCNYIIDRWSDYCDKKGIFTDVLHYGCQSGVVGELIYYSDTVRFYKQYRQEINAYLTVWKKELIKVTVSCSAKSNSKGNRECRPSASCFRAGNSKRILITLNGRTSPTACISTI